MRRDSRGFARTRATSGRNRATTGTVPDLHCDGRISLDNVNPGSTAEGSFTVENIGEPNSRLEWIVNDYPEWGRNWKFQPRKGMLTPEDNPVIVDVSFEAPNEQNKEFTGVIEVFAIGDPDDFHEIPITVITPRNRARFHIFFQQFIEHFPNIYLLLNQLLGLH